MPWGIHLTWGQVSVAADPAIAWTRSPASIHRHAPDRTLVPYLNTASPPAVAARLSHGWVTQVHSAVFDAGIEPPSSHPPIRSRWTIHLTEAISHRPGPHWVRQARFLSRPSCYRYLTRAPYPFSQMAPKIKTVISEFPDKGVDPATAAAAICRAGPARVAAKLALANYHASRRISEQASQYAWASPDRGTSRLPG